MPTGQSALVQFLPIVLIAIIFYLLVFRPMKSRQKKVETMIANLKSGDRVITTGGIYGTIAAVKEKTFLLRISEQVKIEVAKSAVAGLQSEGNPAP
ncbi:MAG: preprotein translocase subunit YajC [Acidobacteria bacterium]|nr:preprotein translocase subunit YajC [Acidobacteriota bacterium]